MHLDQLIHDIRFGLRVLGRNPLFTSVAILTLALGIGMNTAVFSVIKAVLLRPLAYPDADRLIWLANHDPVWGDNMASPGDYQIWKDQARSFESMTAYGNQDLPLTADGEAEQERIASITGDFWNITGARTSLGRLFPAGQPNTMVLSWGIFVRRFKSDPAVVGKAVTVKGYPFTITGVLPQDFRFLFPQEWVSGDERRDIDAYISIPEAPVNPGEAVTQTRGPAPWWIYVVGKLKSGVHVENARAEMDTVVDRLARQFPSPTRARMFHVTSLKEKLVGNTRSALLVLLAAVGFVLLIAIVNIANLMLARASIRQKEIAIRCALGAGRLRVIRQFLTESILLALFGGAAGLVLNHWGLAVIVRLGSESIPRLADTRIDASVLLFTLAISLSAGLLFGCGPAMWMSAFPHGLLKKDSRALSAGSSRFHIRGWLVTSELAMAMLLLTGAGLMLKSFWRMSAHAPGFAPKSTLVMRVSLSGLHYAAWPPRQAYINEMLQRVESAPDVQAAGIDGGSLHTGVKVEGAGPAPRDQPSETAIRFVSIGYLRAMGVPLLRGHWPGKTESLFAAIVNESFVRSMGIASDPIGKRVSGSFLSATIVGVVANFKSSQMDAEPRPELYYPFERSPMPPSVRLVVRTSGDASRLSPAIRKLMLGIDSTQPPYEVQTLEQALSGSIAPRRFNLFLLAAFAIAALLLASVGIYGVMAYTVTQRTHEIGMRAALGAHRGEILGMVLRQGMTIALLGIAAGAAAALGLTRLMASLLYDVTPNDPATYAMVAAILGASALLACLIPALKAASVDPGIALRYE